MLIVIIKASIPELKNPNEFCPLSLLLFSICETLRNNLATHWVNVFIYKIINKIVPIIVGCCED